MMTDKLKIPGKKPRNPYVEEMYDGTFRSKRERPENQYERKPKYNKIVIEEEDDFDSELEAELDQQANQDWEDFIADDYDYNDWLDNLEEDAKT